MVEGERCIEICRCEVNDDVVLNLAGPVVGLADPSALWLNTWLEECLKGLLRDLLHESSMVPDRNFELNNK